MRCGLYAEPVPLTLGRRLRSADHLDTRPPINNLRPMTDATLKRLANLRHLALDLDGTLYLGGRVFEFTAPFLAQLEKLGIGRTFFTNNSSKSTKQYVEPLRKIGIEATEQDIYSSTHATLHYLQTQ